jgi:hypothetical protein
MLASLMSLYVFGTSTRQVFSMSLINIYATSVTSLHITFVYSLSCDSYFVHATDKTVSYFRMQLTTVQHAFARLRFGAYTTPVMLSTHLVENVARHWYLCRLSLANVYCRPWQCVLKQIFFAVTGACLYMPLICLRVCTGSCTSHHTQYACDTSCCTPLNTRKTAILPYSEVQSI